MKNSDMPAMPQHYMSLCKDEVGSGLTKLEDFTKAAMQGLLSNGAMIDNVTDRSLSFICLEYYNMIELMVKTSLE